ncbi:flagellar basal body-associated FliL family protein [Vitreimonas flagellata]|uniref:flagellar basal body-associated FliL family protein n=1 Tax=Vitreimonas flagellata TaxID=2560861 RepID=UPI0010755619|nr:flagellar basal body-associated FliL family protein [Vitreimonas flagellata]
MFGKKKKKGDEAEEAEGASPPAEAAEGAEGEAPAKKKMSGKTLVLFIILPAILVLGGGGAAAFLLLKPSGEQHAEAETGDHGKAKGGGGHGAEGAPGEPVPGPNGTMITYGEGETVFVALPEMLVNITGPDGRPAYLKLKLTLEAPNEEVVTALGEHIPRVSDQFNGFLRELRTDDLSGSAGAYRLRLELLRRVNLVIAPLQINAVLIEEMLVQ